MQMRIDGSNDLYVATDDDNILKGQFQSRISDNINTKSGRQNKCLLYDIRNNKNHSIIRYASRDKNNNLYLIDFNSCPRLSKEERQNKIMKYIKKKQNRNFDRKILYQKRQDAAYKRKRNSGKFAKEEPIINQSVDNNS